MIESISFLGHRLGPRGVERLFNDHIVYETLAVSVVSRRLRFSEKSYLVSYGQWELGDHGNEDASLAIFPPLHSVRKSQTSGI